ncbi:hypothetical protein UFOVP276_130 [uncultured Caudovirales phage]|uniref:Uncharacterized protein n=1 Tax=uncultured Caudovirales phage TaxID=2100421 RepID=A0A6J5LCB6_9CAUD|nr:hypothetical protein UFOVP127_24 [uncultured Caudovirales phage]CAB4135174.1 hypothetical protein UFOVP276_130 [uncultured Caudovirales phage]
MKIAVIIPAHCSPSVLLLTVGTLLRTHSQHDLTIHVGVHKNYSDYCADLSLFEELKRIAHIHLVDEIDWAEHNANLNRYSLMHSKNLENLFSQVRYYAFDYLLILDQDLFIKADLISEILNRHPQADMLGAFFDDIADDMVPFQHSGDGAKLQRIPRMTPWCLLLSRRLYLEVLKDLTILRPLEVHNQADIHSICGHYTSTSDLPIFADTLALVAHRCRYSWGMKLGVEKVEKMEEWVHHFFAGSFNYGEWAIREKYGPHVEGISDIYKKTFPNGIAKERCPQCQQHPHS